jgi:hypothetical protein
MQRGLWLLLGLITAAAGCTRPAGGTTPAPATPAPATPAAARDPAIADLERRLAETPDDVALEYAIAVKVAASGRLDATLGWVEKLVTHQWSLGVTPGAFGALAERKELRPLLDLLDARVAQVATSTVAFQIPDPSLLPEGVAWDPVNGRLLVGAVRGRKIIALTEKGVVDLVPATAGGLMSVFGLRVDPIRKIVWAASNAVPGAPGFAPEERGAAALFEIGLDGTILRRFHLPRDGTPHLLDDIALGTDGVVYVTDRRAGTVWSLAPDGVGLEPLVPVGSMARPRGICLAADGGRLLVALELGLVEIDLGSREVKRVRAPRGISLAGIDGLYALRSGLVAIQNGVGIPRVVRFRLGRDGEITAAEVLEAKNPLLATPTTGAVHHGAFYYLANGHAADIDDRVVLTPARSSPLVLRAGLAGEP